jgi:hypothetical protein
MNCVILTGPHGLNRMEPLITLTQLSTVNSFLSGGYLTTSLHDTQTVSIPTQQSAEY